MEEEKTNGQRPERHEINIGLVSMGSVPLPLRAGSIGQAKGFETCVLYIFGVHTANVRECEHTGFDHASRVVGKNTSA